ncbi:hypothetical protein J2801_003531 [Paraburkholderia phenoliruptrix]|uniref:hypothetical protein n=1 Tax=Paraburkholderia phenoliruptrix TaxID=252970 RepID=UPI002854E48D|nr:hypothetical protein [Paraburkholderia phenoliruptrix]MDR6421243.1 hypothetical protein [Paraburkholderia phenoliruptrix]
MKIRHIKRRAKRPDFRMARIMGTLVVEVKSAAAAVRFFGTTTEEDQRAAEFFGIGK